MDRWVGEMDKDAEEGDDESSMTLSDLDYGPL